MASTIAAFLGRRSSGLQRLGLREEPADCTGAPGSTKRFHDCGSFQKSKEGTITGGVSWKTDHWFDPSLFFWQERHGSSGLVCVLIVFPYMQCSPPTSQYGWVKTWSPNTMSICNPRVSSFPMFNSTSIPLGPLIFCCGETHGEPTGGYHWQRASRG